MTRTSIFNQEYFLTDGGLETTLIFHQGLHLNHFSAFELLKDKKGRDALQQYYTPYLNMAHRYELDFIMETPTWRANPDWGNRLGYTAYELNVLNKLAVHFVRNLVHAHHLPDNRVIISGNIGPRGDGYKATSCMTAEEAATYHTHQIQSFALADADMVTAMTLNYSAEAIGVVQAARSFNIPVVISFTVETDGKLPDGETLGEAIRKTDDATGHYAAHYMINCAHPEHFSNTIEKGDDWKLRIRGIRANASTKSHVELDECDTLDAGDKCLLADGYKQLKQWLPNLCVIGGCCGTDHSHLEKIYQKLMNREKTGNFK